MNDVQKINLVTIPGSPFVALADDANLTPTAIRAGTIILEKHIEELPEVKALSHRSMVLDVGAFIGDTALIFAKTGATVFAYEAQYDAYFAAKWNTQAEARTFVSHSAIGNGEWVTINQDPIAGNLGTRSVAQVPASTVMAWKLDEIAYHLAPTFIKIDVEGFEPAVVRGAAEILRVHKPTLLIEIYPELLARQGWTPADITVPLKAAGYSIREAIGNSTEPRWDIIAIHESKTHK